MVERHEVGQARICGDVLGEEAMYGVHGMRLYISLCGYLGFPLGAHISDL